MSCDEIGIQSVIGYARRLGIRSPLEPYLSTALGTSGVSLLEITRAYAVFPNGGRRVVPHFVRRVLDREIDWLILREGRYEELTRDSSGPYKSEVFPGLWLDPAAMVHGELAGVLDTLRQGLATPEHAAFADRLKASGRST